MIGRQDDVKELAAALLGATNVVVAGPRRTGKTSVCQAAVNRAQRQGSYTVSLDLFRIADAAELAEALALGVIANRSAAHRIVRRARELGRAALGAAQATAMLKLQSQLGEAIELALTPGLAAQDPQRALDLALELPERVAVADGKRLILFFDEFQELAGERRPYGDPDEVTKRMRAIFQRSTSVSFLFAGSVEHVMRELFAPNRGRSVASAAFTSCGRSRTPTGPPDCPRGLPRTTARWHRRRWNESSNWASTIRE